MKFTVFNDKSIKRGIGSGAVFINYSQYTGLTRQEVIIPFVLRVEWLEAKEEVVIHLFV